MTSPDFRTFVGTLVPGHEAWLAGPSPTGTQWLEQYVGDTDHQDGLLWQYEAWRTEHGYVRVRPWNGSEALGRLPTPEIPFPGRVLPFSDPFGAGTGPTMSIQLSEGRTTAQLQADFADLSALGAAIRNHWTSVRNHPVTDFGEGGLNDLYSEPSAMYSVRFWGFMKWASVIRARFLSIPVFGNPIVYDADGVPHSDIEFADYLALWHVFWHISGAPGTTACTLVSAQAANNPFAPSASAYGQVCTAIDAPPRTTPEFLAFHRDLLATFNKWRRRVGMPPVGAYRPPGLHLHRSTVNGQPIPEGIPAGAFDVPVEADPVAEYNQLRDTLLRHFNTPTALSIYAEGQLHGEGHLSPEHLDIGNGYTNNYSPRFHGWHRWIDRLWEIRQPRFDSLRPVTSAGADYSGILTVVRPTPNPDEVQPANALTSESPDGRGSLWVIYNVRPETYGRSVTLTISADVFGNSGDLNPVPGLGVTLAPITLAPAQQGTDSAPIEIAFSAPVAGEGAFARQALPGGGVGFKNGRVRIRGTLTPVGTIPGSFATGSDQFDYTEWIDIVLVKESRPPDVSAILNKSSFSVDEIQIKAGGAAESSFENAFFIVLQDPAPSPSGLSPYSVFADPSRTAVSGIFTDTALRPNVEVVDDSGTSLVSWATVELVDVFKEHPTLHDNASQRVLFRHTVRFSVANTGSAVPNPGDISYIRLRTTARDRSGNIRSDALSPRIKIFREANPYMIDIEDENPHWLSVDARVFSVRQLESRFGHTVGAEGGPHNYLATVLGEFRSGVHDFNSIAADHNQQPLELTPSVAGQDAHNFAIARVRVRTTTPVSNVRVFFRLFTTAVSNLSFTPVNYPTSAGASPIALLGKTPGAVEIVSIPFFATPRVETRAGFAGAASMTTQADPENDQTLPVTPPGGETLWYFGAVLDINSDTPRYPQSPSGDGPFPASQSVSIRNIVRGQHQCMVAEVFYAGDPTEPNSNPGTSDNLAQRNLLIIEASNPAREAMHMAQHSFDLVLPSLRERAEQAMLARREHFAEVEKEASTQSTTDEEPNEAGVQGREFMSSLALALAQPPSGFALANAVRPAAVSWRLPGFDELVFFWNNLPANSEVEVYLPSLDVGYLELLRVLRGAPETFRLLDDHTLAMTPLGVTYVAVPNLGGEERVAGLLTISLPDTIKGGQLFTVDVLQVRPSTGAVVGAFQLMIPVTKAAQIYAREARVLGVFEERLKLTPTASRWHPVLFRQIEYLRARAKAFVEEVAEECAEAPGEDEGRGQRIRVLIERVKVLDPHGPLVGGSGLVSLIVRVSSTNAGGISNTTRLPAAGAFKVQETPGGFTIEINKEIFRGIIENNLTVEVFSAEEEEGARTCYYRRVIRRRVENILGHYRPGDEKRDPENVGDWQLWYRIEGL